MRKKNQPINSKFRLFLAQKITKKDPLLQKKTLKLILINQKNDNKLQKDLTDKIDLTKNN